MMTKVFASKENNSNDINMASLDVLRWMATLAVIYYHVFNAVVSYTDFGNTKYSQVWYDLLAVPLRWHVPTFLMISGALFMNTQKVVTYKAVFFKYIKRLILALLFFGFLFSMIEYYFDYKTIDIKSLAYSLNNVVIGKSWSHMWYLYMMIGIYLIVPPLKIFINAAGTKNILYLLILLFVFVSCLPEIFSYYNYKTGFYIPFSGAYILYFILGYFCLYRIRYDDKLKRISAYSILVCCLLLFCNAVGGANLPLSTSSPLICVLTVSIFVFVNSIKVSNKYLSKGRYLCFGIYLTHMIFINFAYKYLKIQPFDYFPILSMLVLGTIFLLLSFIS